MSTLNFHLEKLVRDNVARLKPYSSARDEFKDFHEDMVFLDANENPYNNGVNRYPDPQQVTLKQHLSSLKRVPVDQILLGNGSDEVLDLLFRAFCEPKTDNIITLPPTYGMYGVLADTNAIANREVLLSNDFQPQVHQILEQVDHQTKMLFLCSPNNPTANSFDVDKIVQLLENFRGLVIVDEAYIDFSAEESWASKLQEYPNLVVTQTLSKAYGLAGIRLGICYASAEIIAILNKIKPPYNVNELTQKRALERVLDDASVQNEITAILRERDALSKVLLEVNFVEKVYPSEANFILAKVDDANKRYEQLIKRGIVVRNRSTQALCENTLRFTVGTSEENQKLISALKELV
ncbi:MULTISPECIES: histidinol-phosphate transaminase [Leeuwenhoekiella]|jgi:histidinol-phosphate aminotransferase|uniref:histidinol-phosphate transaminase n=1 Tax=Leeuwenhoekiella TaxID=283735 RepID=UPI000C3FC6EF|nr:MULTISPECIES: histidinol-phosphate transaminase [Leeuwenhoekiella]MAO45128.1 histidinol-phosphate transaminase [Leeuwenhoekiella sp.]MBQ52694.1 histidinol-phosphate transaminase [Leeuwenhoekiella sp.]HBT11319.1 histidinol-phosphate transaminase [Leeuwenhoekiella sp.]HCW65298.1 histidinol-phosphate transaminase [Leeuwenhoekiella sp.]|tara:strand:- start:183 stop:1235 length:1053 start_codon:yes stop_codon:yes gene_type:complete